MIKNKSYRSFAIYKLTSLCMVSPCPEQMQWAVSFLQSDEPLVLEARVMVGLRPAPFALAPRHSPTRKLRVTYPQLKRFRVLLSQFVTLVYSIILRVEI